MRSQRIRFGRRSLVALAVALLVPPTTLLFSAPAQAADTRVTTQINPSTLKVSSSTLVPAGSTCTSDEYTNGSSGPFGGASRKGPCHQVEVLAPGGDAVWTGVWDKTGDNAKVFAQPYSYRGADGVERARFLIQSTGMWYPATTVTINTYWTKRTAAVVPASVSEIAPRFVTVPARVDDRISGVGVSFNATSATPVFAGKVVVRGSFNPKCVSVYFGAPEGSGFPWSPQRVVAGVYNTCSTQLTNVTVSAYFSTVTLKQMAPSSAPGMCAAASASLLNLNRVVLAPCASRQLKDRDVYVSTLDGRGVAVLRTPRTEQCLGMPNGSTQNGAQVTAVACQAPGIPGATPETLQSAQRWYMAPGSSTLNNFTLQNMRSLKFLDTANGATAQNTPVVQGTQTNSATQRWFLPTVVAN